LPEEAKIFFVVQNFELEMINVGFDDLLLTSYLGDRDNPIADGDPIPWLRKGYQAIGCTRSQEWLKWVLRPFGSEGPAADGRKREEQMSAMKPDYWQQFETLEKDWMDNVGNTNGDLHGPTAEWLLAKYAVKHAAILRAYVEKNE
jgi:hypothetical protein